MNVEGINHQLEKYRSLGKKMFVTSSFQTQSIPLLHILSNVGKDIDVLFINTGFHFPETITFRNEVVAAFGLNVIDVRPSVPKIQQKDGEGQLFFLSDPDYCCYLNKTQPLEPYLMQYNVWINGVRADQSAARKKMKTEQAAPFGTLRFHPMLDWTSKDIYEYRKQYALPEHPLDAEGYRSIGCVPCTQKFDLSDERSARWFGMNKTECGLHTDLIK
jgi:phosphoadenosine phosphosulfate reductase